MTDDGTLWMTLRKNIPRERWIPIADIFRVVQRSIVLDAEDLKCTNSRSGSLRWHSNVRRILYAKRRDGTVSGRKSP